MKLSDLKTGETGFIVKVAGHGGFRKRIIEMGFIKGKKIEVLLNAPLRDPVKYKIMGYEVSLRHSEADLIEVVSENEALEMGNAHLQANSLEIKDNNSNTTDKLLKAVATRKSKEINVALVLSLIHISEPTRPY